MKSFFKDYWELCKESNKWMKKHWKGYLVLQRYVRLLLLLHELKENHYERIIYIFGRGYIRLRYHL